MTKILFAELHQDEAQLALADEFVDGLQNRCQELQDTLEAALQEKEEIDDLRRQMGNAQRERDTARTEERKTVALLQDERDGRSKDAREAKRAYNALAAEKSGLQQQLSGLEEVSADASRKLREAQVHGKGLKALCDQAVEKLDEKEREKAECMKRLKDAETLLKEHGIELAHEREERIKHLQYIGVRRFMKYELSRGWTTWHSSYLHYAHLRRQAMARWGNRALWKSLRTWKDAYPPMIKARRLMEPLEQRIAELESAAHKDKEAHVTLLKKCEQYKDLLREHGILIEEEREQRIAHLVYIAIRRVMKLELARGWSKWHEVHRKRKDLMKKAMGRWTKQALWVCLTRWRRRCPLRKDNSLEHYASELERKMAAVNELLRLERLAHEQTKSEAGRGAEKETAMLRALVRELQNVLAEAMKAPSWVGCRQLLYHESCRYLPEAATHGKLLPPSLRKKASVQVGGMLTGRLSAGSDIMSIIGPADKKAKDEVQALRRNPSIQHRPAPAVVNAPSRSQSMVMESPKQSPSLPSHRAAPVRLTHGDNLPGRHQEERLRAGETRRSLLQMQSQPSAEETFTPRAMTLEASRSSPFVRDSGSPQQYRSSAVLDRGSALGLKW